MFDKVRDDFEVEIVSPVVLGASDVRRGSELASLDFGAIRLDEIEVGRTDSDDGGAEKFVDARGAEADSEENLG